MVSRIRSREVCKVMREEFSLPLTSGWKALFAFMRVLNDGLEAVGEVGEVGVMGVIGEIGVAGTSVSWSLAVAAVQDEEAEASLLLREGGCNAAATAAI